MIKNGLYIYLCVYYLWFIFSFMHILVLTILQTLQGQGPKLCFGNSLGHFVDILHICRNFWKVVDAFNRKGQDLTKFILNNRYLLGDYSREMKSRSICIANSEIIVRIFLLFQKLEVLMQWEKMSLSFSLYITSANNDHYLIISFLCIMVCLFRALAAP